MKGMFVSLRLRSTRIDSDASARAPCEWHLRIGGGHTLTPSARCRNYRHVPGAAQRTPNNIFIDAKRIFYYLPKTLLQWSAVYTEPEWRTSASKSSSTDLILGPGGLTPSLQHFFLSTVVFQKCYHIFSLENKYYLLNLIGKRNLIKS